MVHNILQLVTRILFWTHIMCGAVIVFLTTGSNRSPDTERHELGLWRSQRAWNARRIHQYHGPMLLQAEYAVVAGLPDWSISRHSSHLEGFLATKIFKFNIGETGIRRFKKLGWRLFVFCPMVFNRNGRYRSTIWVV